MLKNCMKLHPFLIKFFMPHFELAKVSFIHYYYTIYQGNTMSDTRCMNKQILMYTIAVYYNYL